MVETTENRLAEGTFKKCDMHVHSSSCYSRDYGEAAFLSALLESDLDVLAVTDHNSIDVELLSRLQLDLAKKRKTLIGGVELNIKLRPETINQYHLVLGEGRKGDYFHAVVWFSMEHAAEMSAIVDELFMEAIRKEDSGDSIEDDLRSLSRKNFSKRTAGIAVYLEDVQEKTSAIPHFFVPHENKGDRNLSYYLPNALHGAPLLANQAYKDKLFYYSHAMAVEGGEKSRKHISEGLAQELHITVAALLFSDAMTVDEIGSKFTWIDFDSDLDSLLLAISDPESRIKTSEEYPVLPQSNTATFLESVTFNTLVGDGAMGGHETTLRFSPGYNGIVGSRGSGKSLLACLLAGRGLDTYAQFVDQDSVRFKIHGGIPIGNHPKCLYLAQGELERIFEDGSYEEIPFLKEHVAPLKEDANKETVAAKARLSEIIGLEKKLLTAFCEKYDSELVRLDYLDMEAPSGITLSSPPIPPKDFPKVRQAKTAIEGAVESLKAAETGVAATSFKSSYPENAELFAALDEEIRAVEADIHVARARASRLASFLEMVDEAWFSGREQMISLFATVLNAHNSVSDATALTQYNLQASEAASFLDDLLELRQSLAYLNDEAKAAYEKMHRPISPVELSNAEEPIVISLVHSEEDSFEDKIAALLSASSCKNQQALVEALLCQNDNTRLHGLFNGTKFKACKNKDYSAHQAKFFELLEESISSSDGLETEITIDGHPIGSMSPGMKAQALLKLFLNDGVTSGEWTYIVLDQPEDNLDVATIKDFLIDRLKKLKLNVQFFVVSHSAPVIINGDARTVIVCENDERAISYSYGAMNEAPVKQSIADVLDGGERYLKMRLNKYNFQVGDER